MGAVSYTHLDVYKRQLMRQVGDTSGMDLPGDTRLFDRVARRWGVDYAIRPFSLAVPLFSAVELGPPFICSITLVSYCLLNAPNSL